MSILNMLKTFAPFVLIAAAIYSLGIFVPSFTATVMQDAAKAKLGLPSIQVTETTWNQMDLADQWSTDTWSVVQLSDGSGFATRPAESWFSDYQLACIHQPLGSSTWDFVGYDVDTTTLTTGMASTMGFLWHNAAGIAAGFLIIIGAAYVMYRAVSTSVTEAAVSGLDVQKELNEVRQEKEAAVESKLEKVVVTDSEVSNDIIQNQVNDGLIDEDEAHRISKDLESNKTKLADAANNPVVDLGNVTVGQDLDERPA